MSMLLKKYLKQQQQRLCHQRPQLWLYLLNARSQQRNLKSFDCSENRDFSSLEQVAQLLLLDKRPQQERAGCDALVADFFIFISGATQRSCLHRLRDVMMALMSTKFCSFVWQ